MKVEMLLQNALHLFIIAIILEAAIMALFSIKSLNVLLAGRANEATRDLLVIGISLYVCFKAPDMRIFWRTGIRLPLMADTIISALVITWMTNITRQMLSRFKQH